MPTRIVGKFKKPDDTPMPGVTIQAYLVETAAESAGETIYASGQTITATSDSTGAWQMNLWSNTNGVLPTKYVFLITYTQGQTPIKYELAVPNVDEVLFSDLMVNYSYAARSEELFNLQPTKYDFNIIQGNTLRRKFDLYDDSNQPISLSGWSAKLLIRDNNSSWFKLLSPTIDPTLGRINIYLSSTDTWELADKALEYELTIYTVDDTVKIMYGNISVTSSFLKVTV